MVRTDYPGRVSDQIIHTLFLLGAGAQENSWAPVIKAIKGLQFAEIGDPAKVTDSESATSFFATFVNYRRHLHLVARDRAVAAALQEKARDMEPKLAAAHRELKTRIATELRRAVEAGTIKLRPRFLSMLKEYRRKGSVAFLTTNWDPVLEKKLRELSNGEPSVGYLHGSIADPDLMLLPGEIVAERYRTVADRRRMQKMFSIWKYIESSRRIVIYGHSISAIEAELRLMLCMGLSDAPPGRIVIASLKEDAKDVRQRILPLMPPGRRWRIDLRPVDRAPGT
jgi:hypothetical protein